MGICKSCKRTRRIQAKGLCFTCYISVASNVAVICFQCNSRKKDMSIANLQMIMDYIKSNLTGCNLKNSLTTQGKQC